MKEALVQGITYNHIDLQQYFDFSNTHVYYIDPPLADILPLGSDNENYGDNFLERFAYYMQDKSTLPQTLFHKLNFHLPGNIMNIIFDHEKRAEFSQNNRRRNIDLNDDEIISLVDMMAAT